MGSDLSVVNAARVSFHKESDWGYDLTSGEGQPYLKESDAKLINYLAKHGHWTPFGHAFLSFRIKAPIFVARQLVKHQVGLCWNEVSRRYVDEEPEFWFPDVWRGKPVNAKQGSSGVVPNRQLFSGDEDSYTQEGAVQYALNQYNWMLMNGVAPEQARIYLPLNTHTEWIWSGSLAAFARVCKLRLDPHAQAETAVIAVKINDAIPESFAHSWKAILNG